MAAPISPTSKLRAAVAVRRERAAELDRQLCELALIRTRRWLSSPGSQLSSTTSMAGEEGALVMAAIEATVREVRADEKSAPTSEPAEDVPDPADEPWAA